MQASQSGESYRHKRRRRGATHVGVYLGATITTANIILSVDRECFSWLVRHVGFGHDIKKSFMRDASVDAYYSVNSFFAR